MRSVTVSLLAILPPIFLSGCLSFGHSQADTAGVRIESEVGELVKSYRMCLQKYEAEPVKAKENCAGYRDAIHDLAPDSKKSVVAELLDRLGSKGR
jgi:hypothetical protein